MLDNLCIHQKHIAYLLLPLVLLRHGRRPDPLHVTEGVRARRVNTPIRRR